MNCRTTLPLLFLLLAPFAYAEEKPFFERFTIASHKDGAKKAYPCIATLGDGRMLAVWCNWPSAGCHVVGAFSDDSGKTWGEPFVLIKTPTGRDYDPSILVSGKKVFVTSTTLPPNTAIRTSTTWCTRSDDNGKTWSELYKIPMNHRYTCGKAHRGIRLKSGTLLMGYSWDMVCEKGEELHSEGSMVLRAGVMRSVDDGKTWQNGGDTFAEYEKVHDGAVHGTDEPGLAELPDGSVYMLMRTGGRHPWEARSDDEGRTWKEIKPSPLTGCNAPAALCDFTSKRGKGVLCVWDNGIARYPLCATVSFDGARTWSRPKDVAGPTEGRQASYPNCVQAPDGTLVAVWQQDTPTGRDIRCARFNVAWVLDDPIAKMQEGLEKIRLPRTLGKPTGYEEGDPTAATPKWRKHAGGGKTTPEGTIRLEPVGGYHIDAAPDVFDGNTSLLVECRMKIDSQGPKAGAAAELWIGGSNPKSGCRLLFRADAVAFNAEFNPKVDLDATAWHEYRVVTNQKSRRAYLFVDNNPHPVLAAPLESVEGLDINRILFGDSGGSEYDVHGTSEWDWVRWNQVEDAASAEPAKVDVFVGGEGYNIFRIPSLVCTNKGTLLAFCEGRKGNDQSPTDMVLRRSLDGGKTWEPMQILAKVVPEAAMDPTAVVERTTGKIILVYDRWPEMPKGKKLGQFARKPGLGRDSVTTWITTSDDDGVTWSEPKDITATTKRPEWTEACHGPGVGIQMRSGRIVIPCFENRSEETGWGTCWNYALLSDDLGKTWRISDGQAGPGVNETQVVERLDGTLFLNMRSDDPKKKCRMGATSSDGGNTWSKPFEIPALPEPCCQASMIRYSWPDENGGKSRILYCGPGTKDGRHTGTVRLSYDEAKTWPVAKVIHKEYFGYCCLTVLPDGSIGCLFEDDGCRKIVFCRFSLEWLAGEK